MSWSSGFLALTLSSAVYDLCDISQFIIFLVSWCPYLSDTPLPPWTKIRSSSTFCHELGIQNCSSAYCNGLHCLTSG
jgi:hypothetical protein